MPSLFNYKKKIFNKTRVFLTQNWPICEQLLRLFTLDKLAIIILQTKQSNIMSMTHITT